MEKVFHTVWHGAAYYPELWKTRIDEDIHLMQEAGINMVRVAEFAWSSMEPEEGRYDWGWLHETMDKCHAAGISVVLCTPTPTPPRWLTLKYPEVIRYDVNGPYQHGSRQHISHTSPTFRHFSRQITQVLAQEFGAHPALVAWQTDNEFLCHVDADYSPSAIVAWHEWLAKKYGDIHNLNECWQTYIWSENYPSFDSVPSAGKTPFGQHHVSLASDWWQFTSDTVVEFQREQTDIIRQYSSAPITHNHIAQDRLYSEDLFADLDFAATDIYIEHQHLWKVFRTMDWMRGAKMAADGYTPYMILETSPSHNGSTCVGHPTHPDGVLAVEAMLFLGMGGCAFNYWLWRQQQSGTETCHGAVVTSWGTPSVGWRNVRAVTEMMAKISPLLNTTMPLRAEIALHESKRARLHIMRGEKFWNKVSSWSTPVDEVYRPLLEEGYWRDVRFEGADISGYKAVLSPFMPVLTDELIDRMVAYMEAGGTWVVGPISGCRTEYGTVPTDAGLGRLDAIAGVKTLYPAGFESSRGTLNDSEVEVGWYCFGLEATAPDTIVRGKYLDGPAKDTVWCVERPVGKGRIILLAAHAPGQYGLFINELLADLQITRYQSSWGTSIIPRVGAGVRAYLIANWDGQGGTVTLPEAGVDVMTGAAVPAGEVTVPAFGIMAVEVRV